MNKYCFGVDLGGTKIYTALVDLEGNIIKEKTVETLAQGQEEKSKIPEDIVVEILEETIKDIEKF